MHVAVSALLGLLASDCTFVRMVYHNAPSLEAPALFDARPVRASSKPVPLPRAATEANFALTPTERFTFGSFDGLLEKNATKAIVVLQKGTIVYERYFDGVDENTLLPTFSMSKTFAAVLVGCALRDRLLESVHQPIVEFLPELAARPRYDQVTIDHLLRMTAGIDFDEETTAGGMFYYADNLRDRMYLYDVKWPPGQHYLYGSVSIQLLWDVLHRSLGGKTVARYFEERIWEPLGAEHGATWSLDSEKSGIEKLFGGFNTTARDLSRLGLLFLHRGTWNGRTVVSPAWVDESLRPDLVAGKVRTTDGIVQRAKYQWFLTTDGCCHFAKGYQGQYMFVYPEKEVVIVRFGEGYGTVDWIPLFERMAESL